MAVQVPIPNDLEKYVKPDGRLTKEGLILLQQAVEKLQDHEDRLVANGL